LLAGSSVKRLVSGSPEAARRGQAVRAQGIGTAGRIEEHSLLVAAAERGMLELVAGPVVQRGRSMSWPGGAALA
jgi:hypothetical protein